MSRQVDVAKVAMPILHTNHTDLRIDKNVAFNISSFRTFGEESRLLKAVVIYMALNHQEEDLFGFYKLDPTQFAKLMGFTKTNLFRKHENPFFLNHDPNALVLLHNEENYKPNGRMSEHRTWSSCLENALYRLTNQNIVDNYRHRNEDKTIVVTQRFNFIDEIRFELVKKGKVHEVVYYYKPNSKYEDNLRNYFLRSKIDKYISLRKPKLDEAYLDILNRIENAKAKNLNAILFNIDTAAKIMQIGTYKDFSLYKRKVTEKFELLRKTIGEDIQGLSFIWINPKDNITSSISNIKNKKTTVKNKNVVQLSWNKLSKEEERQKNSKVFNNIFKTELNRALITSYFQTSHSKKGVLSEERKKKAFYSWIFSNNDMDIKEIAFKHIYFQTYKNTVSLAAFTKDFIKILKYMAKIQKEHSCFQFKDNVISLSKKPETIIFKHFHEVLTYFETHFSDK